MTEYDRESGDAFGLVFGIEPEWGYFNLEELKELNILVLDYLIQFIIYYIILQMKRL